MITRRITNALLSNRFKCEKIEPRRNVQISVIGAANDVGSNLTLLLKQNHKISHLKLYDDDERIKGVGMELAAIPGGPSIEVFSSGSLQQAVQSSHLIVMVARSSLRLDTGQQMLAANAPMVQQLCRAMLTENPEALLAISTNPINSIIPFACGYLSKYSQYNSSKIFGITHIDTARCRAFVAHAFQISPYYLDIPVIGGQSDKTIVPLFSNITPDTYSVDNCQADMLTRLMRKAETEVFISKQGTESSTLAMAWSVNEFVDGLVDAVRGSQVVLNCFTVNPHFGTRFFSGPTSISSNGITEPCSNFSMNEYESQLLQEACAAISNDVSLGEDYMRYFEGIRL